MNLTFYIAEVLRVTAPSPEPLSLQDFETVHRGLIAAASPDLLGVILKEGKV